jgi:Saxitoxin biosynthesis operon protein SxtJ
MSALARRAVQSSHVSSMNIHETLRPVDVRPSSDRSFGLVFTAVFAIAGLAPLWSGRPVRWWALAVGAAFLLAAWLRPSALTLLNRAWLQVGHAISRVTSPIVLGILFYGVFTPYGWTMRLFGRDRLHLRFDRTASSYWMLRQPPGPSADSMSRQF